MPGGAPTFRRVNILFAEEPCSWEIRYQIRSRQSTREWSGTETSCMPILLEALCDKSCFARKFAWLGKRNATISPVQPKVNALAAHPGSCVACAARGVRCGAHRRLCGQRGRRGGGAWNAADPQRARRKRPSRSCRSRRIKSCTSCWYGEPPARLRARARARARARIVMPAAWRPPLSGFCAWLVVGLTSPQTQQSSGGPADA